MATSLGWRTGAERIDTFRLVFGGCGRAVLADEPFRGVAAQRRHGSYRAFTGQDGAAVIGNGGQDVSRIGIIHPREFP